MRHRRSALDVVELRFIPMLTTFSAMFAVANRVCLRADCHPKGDTLEGGVSASAKTHQQEHRPQRPTEHSDPTQHAKGKTGDCPGPRKETAPGRNVTQGGLPVGEYLLDAYFCIMSHPRSAAQTNTL